MKAKILNFTILLLGSIVISCESADAIQQESQEQKDDLSKKQSSLFSNVSATRINSNSGKCQNDILIFSSWDDYWKTIDLLDEMIESDCDMFDSKVSADWTDDEYDAAAKKVGFDEDNALRKFESDLSFCSLRKKIDILETDWLNIQDDGEWDENTDPDNHFIDDVTERSLLSERSEVIIGNEKDGYIYYKFLDDDGNWIEVHNNDFETMALVSNDKIPSKNSNVKIVTSQGEKNKMKCRNRVKQIRYEYLGADRLKRKSKIKRALGTVCNNDYCSAIIGSKIKSVTKGYRKVNGKWRSKRLWIAVGINGQAQNQSGLAYISCNEKIDIHTYKEKRRRRVQVKKELRTFPSLIFQELNYSIQPNSLYSYHKSRNLIVNKDFYEM